MLQSFDGQGNLQCKVVDTTTGITKVIITELLELQPEFSRSEIHVCGSNCSGCDGILDFNCVCESVLCSRTRIISSGEGSVSLTCPQGSFLAGGGFENPNPDVVSIRKNSSSGTAQFAGQTWTVEAKNSSTTPQNRYALVECATFP